MNEIKKYEKLKEIKKRLIGLNSSFIDLVNILENELIDDEMKTIIERLAWEMIETLAKALKEELDNHGK